MSFGFSAGDFVAATKLVADVISSLRDAGGARQDYQELVRELESLDRALKHVDKLSGPDVGGIKCAALMCRHPLEGFLDKIKKYERSLGLCGKSSLAKNTAGKLEWGFGRKEEVRKLRDYLSLHIGSINMLLLSHGLETLEVTRTEGRDSHEDFRQRLATTHTAVVKLGDDVEAQSVAVKQNGSMLAKLFGVVSDDIAAPLRTLAGMVSHACISTQQIYTVVLELRSSIIGLETRYTFFQAPCKVEDALGRIFPVPSEYSYSDLEAIIQRRFLEGPGSRQVKDGQYSLCNTKNTKQTLSSQSDVGLLPGMSVTMAIVLEVSNGHDQHCPMPRCGSKKTKAVAGGGRTCGECNIWFDQSIKGPNRKRKFNEHSIERYSERFTRGKAYAQLAAQAPAQTLSSRKVPKMEENSSASHVGSQDDLDDLLTFKNVRVQSFDSPLASAISRLAYREAKQPGRINRKRTTGATKKMIPELSRQPTYQELQLMCEFDKHARGCRACTAPFMESAALISSYLFCSDCFELALRFKKRVIVVDGVPLDHDLDDRTEVSIPFEYGYLRSSLPRVELLQCLMIIPDIACVCPSRVLNLFPTLDDPYDQTPEEIIQVWLKVHEKFAECLSCFKWQHQSCIGVRYTREQWNRHDCSDCAEGS